MSLQSSSRSRNAKCGRRFALDAQGGTINIGEVRCTRRKCPLACGSTATRRSSTPSKSTTPFTACLRHRRSYRLPEASTFANWRERAPADFLYAIKASRFPTHLKRLLEPEEPVMRSFEHAPRAWRSAWTRFSTSCRRAFIATSIASMPFWPFCRARSARSKREPRRAPLQHTIEFRHPSWYVDETYSVLNAHGVALCLHDKAGSAITSPIDGPFVYVRFHGPGGRYFGRYDRDRIAGLGGTSRRSVARRPGHVRVLQQRPRGHGGLQCAGAPKIWRRLRA